MQRTFRTVQFRGIGYFKKLREAGQCENARLASRSWTMWKHTFSFENMDNVKMHVWLREAGQCENARLASRSWTTWKCTSGFLNWPVVRNRAKPCEAIRSCTKPYEVVRSRTKPCEVVRSRAKSCEAGRFGKLGRSESVGDARNFSNCPVWRRFFKQRIKWPGFAI